jgi:hypothetical protein
MQFAGLTALPLFLAIEIVVCDLAYGVSCGDEKKIQSRSVLAKENSVFFWNGENDMPVRCIETHGFGTNGKHFLIFDTTGCAETGMTFSVEYHFVTAVRAFENIKTKITCITEDGLLYIIQDDRTCFSGFIHFYEPVIMIPKDCFDSWFNRIVIDVITAQKIIRELNCIELGIYHYSNYKMSTSSR